MTRKAAMSALLVGVLAAGSGCVAVNVGEPEVFTHTETVVTTGKTPVKTEVVSVEAKAEAEGNRLSAWLEAEVREEYPRWTHEETATVKKQRRLAVGITPGWAKVFLRQKGALHFWMEDRVPYLKYGDNNYRDKSRTNPEGGVVLYDGGSSIWTCYPRATYPLQHTVLLAGTGGLLHLFGTLDTLFVEPFSNGGWKNRQEVLDAENGILVKVPLVQRGVGCYTKEFLDVSQTPAMKTLGKFSPEERKQMGILTCFDINEGWDHGLWHGMGGRLGAPFGLLGAYKYNDVFVEPVRVGSERRMENRAERTRKAVGGPYEEEMRVGGTKIGGKATVGDGESKATFVLPQVERGGAYEATLTFRSLYRGGDAVKNAWDTRTLKKTVWLKEKAKPEAAYTPASPEPAVKEIHHWHETRVEVERKPEGLPYTVEKTADGGGRTVWRIRMREDQTAFDVDRQVKPKILQELREDFAGRNPEAPSREINAWATYTTEDGGRTLVYVGVAELLIPELESLTYSAETRRGTVGMRLRAGADLRRAKEFVRQNISAIVCDKNVALTAGERPPDGARYQSLDENLDRTSGVLTVEFEAVE